MDPITIGLLLGAGTGLLKSTAVDAPKEARQRKLAAATQRYSPWTGLRANPVQEADPFGSALQFGATGASMGSGIKNAASAGELATAQKDYLEALTKGVGAKGTAMGTPMESPSQMFSNTLALSPYTNMRRFG